MASSERTAHGTHRATTSKAAKRKRLKHVKIEDTDNGGFVVKHHFKPEYGGTPKSESHAFNSYDDVEKHLQDTAKRHG